MEDQWEVTGRNHNFTGTQTGVMEEAPVSSKTRWAVEVEEVVVCTFVQVKAREINYVATVVDLACSGTRWPITLLFIGIPLFVTHIGGETMVTCMQRLWHYKGSQRVHQKFVQYNSEWWTPLILCPMRSDSHWLVAWPIIVIPPPLDQLSFATNHDDDLACRQLLPGEVSQTRTKSFDWCLDQ